MIVPFNKDKLGEQDDAGQCWYSMKDRKDASFMKKHFDSSYDGLLAGVAGAVIGAMGVRRMILVHGASEEENKRIANESRWKTAAGAVAGGIAFNAAENWIRVYTEEKAERREDGMMAMEFAQECIDGFVPR